MVSGWISIIIGGLFIFAGLTGTHALKMTNSPMALAVMGLVVIAIGVWKLNIKPGSKEAASAPLTTGVVLLVSVFGIAIAANKMSGAGTTVTTYSTDTPYDREMREEKMEGFYSMMASLTDAKNAGFLQKYDADLNAIADSMQKNGLTSSTTIELINKVYAHELLADSERRYVNRASDFFQQRLGNDYVVKLGGANDRFGVKPNSDGYAIDICMAKDPKADALHIVLAPNGAVQFCGASWSIKNVVFKLASTIRYYGVNNSSIEYPLMQAVPVTLKGMNERELLDALRAELAPKYGVDSGGRFDKPGQTTGSDDFMITVNEEHTDRRLQILFSWSGAIKGVFARLAA